MKCKLFFLPILLLAVHFSNAQQTSQLSLNLSRSFNGTGDMKGYGFSVEYGKYLINRLSFTTSLGANIHSSQYRIIINSQGQTTDASLRFVTAGIQFAGQINFALLRTNKYEFTFGAGPLIRYQSSSYPDVYSIYTSVQTGEPEILASFRQFEKQEITSAGYIISSCYNYTFKKSFFMGAKASFQNDTNADIITQYGVIIGKRF